MLAALAPLSLAQGSDQAQQLLKDGIAKVDHWTDYVRRTGDAKGTVSELATAQSELRAAFDLFIQRHDYADASLSAIKLATIERLLNQQRQAVAIYQQAVQLAQRANRSDYETTALSNLAFSELELGEIDAAADHVREAVRVGATCGNPNYYFEALNTAGDIEVKRGNLVAAGDYMDRALAMSSKVDKTKLYLGYMDRADIYEQLARKCDYQKNFDVCYQSLELAREDYSKALAITQQLGYSYLSQLFQG
ncbi:MAG TPA: tetratricopeptide repeat protein, partial [Blastocatellia bacterium]|nr:tetratricopeptide repeat protein [Blastocatellia bacterium]